VAARRGPLSADCLEIVGRGRNEALCDEWAARAARSGSPSSTRPTAKLLLNCFRDIRRLAHDLGGAPSVMGQGERAVAAIPSKNPSTSWVPGDSPPRCRTTLHVVGVLEFIEWARSPEAGAGKLTLRCAGKPGRHL
jgi:hypothetical protein